MASVVKRTRKDGSPSHFVKYLAGDGRQRWEHVRGRLKNARARKAEVELALAKTGGRWTPPLAVGFEDFARSWLESYARPATRRRSFANYERAVRLDLVPFFGQTPIAAITRARVKALVSAKLAEGKAPGTVRNMLVPLREMLGHAADDGTLPANPAARVRVPQVGTSRRILPPTSEQVATLLTHARPDAREAIIVAAATGLRRGELFAVTWADVDFDARTIRVHSSNFGAVVEETVKSEAGERYVPLFESARIVLAERKLRTRFDRPEDFVFGTSVGTPTDPGNFVRREFKTALVRAGLEAGFRWHDLRHFAVSALIAEGADIKLLQAIAGHASAAMTLDTYGHLMTARVSEAARRFDPLRQAASAEAVSASR